jgi:hypothetical protein
MLETLGTIGTMLFEAIGKLTGIKAGIEIVKDWRSGDYQKKQNHDLSSLTLSEDITKYQLLLSQLDRTEQAIEFEPAITQHFKSVKDDKRKKYYKPLLFIVHGYSHSQPDRCVERIEHYIQNKTSHVGIKRYQIPLGKHSHKEEYYVYKFATEILIDGEERTKDKIINELNKQTEVSPVFISIDLSTDDFSNWKQINDDIQQLITFCCEWKKAKFQNPLIICIHFSYRHTLFGFMNDVINARIKTTLSSIKRENVKILPELAKICSSETCKEVKKHLLEQNCANIQNDKVKEKIENTFKSSKLLTMKQATNKFEKLLEELC